MWRPWQGLLILPYNMSIYLGILVIHWTKVLFMVFTKAVYVMSCIFRNTLRQKLFVGQKMLKNCPATSDRGSEN